MARLPWVRIRDTMGSSEAGPLADTVDVPGTGARRTVRFRPDPHTCVLDERRQEVLDPGHGGTGWLARSGRIPLGYMNDPDKTAATFRRIGGKRFSIPGDRARLHHDGTVEVLGRDSVTINSGGEKIFAEEVEAAVPVSYTHLDVYKRQGCRRCRQSPSSSSACSSSLAAPTRLVPRERCRCSA